MGCGYWYGILVHIDQSEDADTWLVLLEDILEEELRNLNMLN